MSAGTVSDKSRINNIRGIRNGIYDEYIAGQKQVDVTLAAWWDSHLATMQGKLRNPSNRDYVISQGPKSRIKIELRQLK